ncbi:unnamed protein product [Arctogadus glacialis]
MGHLESVSSTCSLKDERGRHGPLLTARGTSRRARAVVERAARTQACVYAPALDGGNVSAEGTPTRESSEAVTATVNIMVRSSRCTGGGRGGLRSQLTQMLPEDIRAG